MNHLENPGTQGTTMKRLLSTLAASFALGCAASALAFSYQGVLADTAGNPLQGNQTVEFRLYAADTGGTALWGCQRNVLLDDNGMFNTEIADGSATVPSGVPADAVLDDVLAANAQTPLWMGITVGGSAGEIAPRLCLLPVPYAVFAHNVNRSSGDFTAAGKVTAAQLAVDGAATFAASATISSNAAVEGDLAVSGTLSGYGTVPVGTILLWSGSTDDIPDGWALCNGQTVNNITTPNLCDRFVVGAGSTSYGVGAQGGNARITLSVDHLPSHSHMYSGDDHVDLVKAGNTGYTAANNIVETTGGYDASSSDSGNGRVYRTSAVGGGTPIDILPPYYALCYIMRVK
jgi:microcystin-dependent protein